LLGKIFSQVNRMCVTTRDHVHGTEMVFNQSSWLLSISAAQK